MLNKRFFVTVTVLFLLANHYAFANGELQWLIHAGGYGEKQSTSNVLDDDGNTYITGYFTDSITFGNFQLVSDGGCDIFVSKIDKNGQCVWALKIGGTGFDKGTSIALDQSLNVYVSGCYSDTVNIDGHLLGGSRGNSDIFVVKFDNSGRYLWSNSAGGNAQDISRSIVVDKDNYVYICGTFGYNPDNPAGLNTAFFNATELASLGGTDIFIAKLDEDGNLVWAKQAGGSNHDGASKIAIGANQKLYVTGYFWSHPCTFTSNELFSFGNMSTFIARFDRNGMADWVKQSEGVSYDYGESLVLDQDDNIILTGCFKDTLGFTGSGLNTAGDLDAYLIKYNKDGDFVWAKAAGGNGVDKVKSLVVDNMGNAYLSGLYNSSFRFGDNVITSLDSTTNFLAKVDKNGNCKWLKSIGKGLSENSVAINNKGFYSVTGGFVGNLTLETSSINSYSDGCDIFLALIRDESNIIVEGDISQNTTWITDTINVVGDVNILSGVTLTIQPNTVVRFADKCSINVFGSIIAKGSASSQIFFEAENSNANNFVFYYPDNTDSDSSLFLQCVFRNFKNVEGAGGVNENNGGVFRVKAGNSVSVIECDVEENESKKSGGAFYVNNSKFNMTNCVMQKNYTHHEGGVGYFENCELLFVNNTIVKNKSDSCGSVFILNNCSGSLVNNIIYYNYSASGIQIVITGASSKISFYNNNIENGVLSISGNTDSFMYLNNIDDNPNFVDGCYKLKGNSPCIDQGIKPCILGGSFPNERDKAGLNRVCGGQVDVGAYEYQVSGIDLNNSFNDTGYELLNNYPNPFNPQTTIGFKIKNEMQVKLNVYNRSGQLVQVLVNGVKPSGFHQVYWNATKLASGIYFYVMEANGYKIVKKAIVIK